MIEQGAAEAFVSDWIAAWNAHDLDAVLAHYADDIVYHSPTIARVTGKKETCLRGKAALATFWAKAMDSAPELNFRLERVYVGADALSVVYFNHRGESAIVTMVFDTHGRVSASIVCYR